MKKEILLAIALAASLAMPHAGWAQTPRAGAAPASASASVASATLTSAEVNTAAQRSASAAVQSVSAPPAPSWKGSPEAIALQEQNNVMKQYHSSLLDTVYWALAAVVTVAVLLVGAGWLVNFKLYDADKQRMKEENEAQITKVRAAVDAQIAEARSEVMRAVEASLQNAADRTSQETIAFRSELMRAVESNVQSAADRVSNESIAFRAELKGTTDALAKNLSTATDVIEHLTKELKQVDKRIYSAFGAVREVEELVWDIKGVSTNVLITQSQSLNAALHAEDEISTKETLGRMKETITTSLLERKEPVNQRLIEIVTERVKEAARLAPVPANEILELLDKIKTKKT